MEKFKNQDVASTFDAYPHHIKKQLLDLRELIFTTANELEDTAPIEETLKWGEPSYCTKHGSTVRIDWKPATAHQYAMYFHCKTKLVDTFKALYGNTFKYEANRAIVFNEADVVPIAELKHCISMALRYHKIKHLPLLGA